MLEVTSTSSEAEIGVDFAQIYQNSTLYEWVQPWPRIQNLFGHHSFTYLYA